MPDFSYTGANQDPNEIIFMDPDTDEVYHVPLYREGKDVNPSVEVSNISTYPPRQLMGDWTRNAHEVVSSFIQSDFTGGGQIRDADEGADLNRFWFGTLGTRHPGQMTLPLRSPFHEDPEEENIAIPLGDHGIDFYASFGKRLVRVTDVAVTDVDELEHVPVAKPAVRFTGSSGQTRLYIPMGSHGYQHWNGAALSSLIDDVAPIEFCEWDNKLYALQSNGEIYESLDGETGWTLKTSVPPDSEPRGMLVFYNASDDPTIYVICRRGVFSIDMSLGKAYKTKLDPPPHGDAGLAAITWREDLYVSYGIGVHQYTGDSIIAMGLDRNDGVPRWLDGRICSMASGYSAMYALVQGYQAAEATLEPSFITDLSWHDFYMSPSSTRPALMMWDSFGWHSAWVPENNTRQPTSLLISTQTGRERLWWGVGNRLYWQDVWHQYYNPEQRQPDAQYEESGWLETSLYDYSMNGQEKIFQAIEVMAHSCTNDEKIMVDYQLDNGPWVRIAEITQDTVNRLHQFKIGHNGFFPDAVTERFDATPFIDLQVRIMMERGSDPTKTPVLESLGILFQKVMSPLRAFSAVIGIPEDVTIGREHKGRTQAEIVAFLDRMVHMNKLIPMCYAGKWRSVRFAGSNGTDHSGVEFTGFRTISVLETLP